MTMEKIEKRNHPKIKIAILFPFMISTVTLVLIYFLKPSLLINEELKSTALFDVFMSVVPCIYIFAVIMYALSEIKKEKNPIEKRTHLYIGFIPIMLVAGGMCQMLFMPELPLCTDNGAMIGVAGSYEYLLGYRSGLDLNAVPNLSIGDRKGVCRDEA